MQAVGRHDMPADQRHQGRRAGANPVGQGGDAERDPLAAKRLALPVQRQVLAELGLQSKCRGGGIWRCVTGL